MTGQQGSIRVRQNFICVQHTENVKDHSWKVYKEAKCSVEAVISIQWYGQRHLSEDSELVELKWKTI